jgi:MFS family permease
MTYAWHRTVFPIATIFSFRLLGLFMLIPVFTLHANELNHANPMLVGIALGSYGLSQGVLQIPFGMLSDLFGRKSIITFGLILFAIGSLMGAWAESIETMIIARTLQGAGAIGSVLMALLADLTPDEQRTKAMAVVGITIGLSFSLAILISPVLTKHYGLSAIFYLTAIMALSALFLLHLVIPTPSADPFHKRDIIRPTQFKDVLKNHHLLRLNAGIFFQHLILTSTFYALPMMLNQQIQQRHLTESWHFYLPLMVIAFILMMPIIMTAERHQRMKPVFIGAVLLTTLSQFALMALHPNWLTLCIAMLLYFIAFNVLEAVLPSQISRQANPSNKGTAMGVYSSCQFLGIFVGGAAAGFIYQYAGHDGIFLLNGLMGLAWIAVVLMMNPNAYQLLHTIPYPTPLANEALLKMQLKQIMGVTHVVISQQTIYLRIEKSAYEKGSAESLVNNFTTNSQ